MKTIHWVIIAIVVLSLANIIYAYATKEDRAKAAKKQEDDIKQKSIDFKQSIEKEVAEKNKNNKK